MKRPHWIGIAIAISLSLSAGSCGGRSAKPDAAENGEIDAAADADCKEFARVLCERRTECAPRNSVPGARFADEDQCTERYALECRGWLDFADSTITTDDLKRCGDELGAATCGRVTSVFQSNTSDLPWCLPTGTLADGTTCMSGAQCASGLCREAAPCGQCASPFDFERELRYEGEPCVDASDCHHFLECQDNVCRNTGCRELGCQDAGAACGGFGKPPICELGGDCKNQNDFGLGTCLPYAREGEACKFWSGSTCLFPAVCVDDVCVLPTPDRCSP